MSLFSPTGSCLIALRWFPTAAAAASAELFTEEGQFLPNNGEVLCAETAPRATVGQLRSEGTSGPRGQKLPAAELHELEQTYHSRLTPAPGTAGPRCQSPR